MCLINDTEYKRLKFIKSVSLGTFKTNNIDMFEEYYSEIVLLPEEYKRIFITSENKINIPLSVLVNEVLWHQYSLFKDVSVILNDFNARYNITYYQWRFIKRYLSINTERDFCIVHQFCLQAGIDDEYKIKQILYNRFITKKIKKLILLYND